MYISQVRLGAIFVGWLTALFLLLLAGAAVAAYLILQGIDPTGTSKQAAQYPAITINLLAFLAVFASFFVGGYVAGRMAAFAGAINGVMTVTTTVITISFAIVFISIVERKLGVDVLTSAVQAASPYGFKIFTGFAFALLGSLLGGKYGEGYVDRLDLAMNVTKPMPNKQKYLEKAPPRPQQPKTQQTKAKQISKTASGKGVDKHRQVG